MVHEGETPPTITFTEPVIEDGKSFSVLRTTPSTIDEGNCRDLKEWA
jgi:hypothetical protein